MTHLQDLPNSRQISNKFHKHGLGLVDLLADIQKKCPGAHFRVTAQGFELVLASGQQASLRVEDLKLRWETPEQGPSK